MGYRPSPRPTFDRPTARLFADVTRHTRGNPEAGLVDDWITSRGRALGIEGMGDAPADVIVGAAPRYLDSD